MHLWTIDMHIQLEFCANRLDVPETLLVIRSSAAHPNLNFMLDESTSNFSKCANYAFECRCNLEQRVSNMFVSGRSWIDVIRTYVGEICDTTTDE